LLNVHFDENRVVSNLVPPKFAPRKDAVPSNTQLEKLTPARKEASEKSAALLKIMSEKVTIS